MAKDTITLMCASGCSPCWMVALALCEKEVEVTDYRELSYEKQEHKSAQVLAINPRGQLPAFKHGDIIVNNAMAICLYLESAFKSRGTQLIPDDIEEKAKMYQRFQEADTLRQKIGNVLFYDWMYPEEGHRSVFAVKRNSDLLSAEVQLWETYMPKTGSFLAGRNFTMADVCAFPCIAALVNYGLSQKKYPKIMSYYNDLKGKTSIAKTWPSFWINAPQGNTALKDI
ncbi:glutathione S-transferase A-like [Brachionichthys hirsutus]|uniref:glutathione S-transferase A-like n=1 Tax=Brachionichthys hirsutus TaxID=412623 RepID=UPI003604BBCA